MVDELTVSVGGIRYTCLRRGHGPKLALLLHGFPDDAGTMTGLAEALAERGFTTVAPYLRGYGPTDLAPDGDYELPTLGRDIVGLVRALGFDRAALVGHDWGALVSYAAVSLYPGSFPVLTTLAIPPIRSFLRNLNTAQLRRSWYIGRFQLPGAVARVRRDELAFIDRLWRDWSPGWTPAPERLESVKRTLSHPGSLAAAISYYRHLRPGIGRVTRYAKALRVLLQPVPVPTLILAGARDGCIGPELFARAEEDVAAPCRVEILADAGHFLHLERPQQVHALVCDHVTRALP